MNTDTRNPNASAPLDDHLAKSIRQLGIPPRPAILEKVAGEVQRDEPDFRRLAAIISADVSIAGSLLKLANSPFFGYRQRARTVQSALSMLGLNAISSAIATIVLRKVLPPLPRLERFWDASARVAQVSGWLVQQIGARDEVLSEDAYTFSLFRDCGIPIMARRFPGYFDTLAKANADPERLFTEVEELCHPTNHAVIGCLLGQSWWLPENTCVAIRHHHDFVSLRAGAGAFSPTSRRLICLAQVAEKLIQDATGRGCCCEWTKMGEASLEILAISPADFAELQAAVRDFLAQEDAA
ncbi:MAG: putative signal transduction protein [Rhodocyclaceae bacterium]|nr:putative signal transduction protein [Rhodocyclaceae bacterium]